SYLPTFCLTVCTVYSDLLFLNNMSTTQFSSLSLHDALPIWTARRSSRRSPRSRGGPSIRSATRSASGSGIAPTLSRRRSARRPRPTSNGSSADERRPGEALEADRTAVHPGVPLGPLLHAEVAVLAHHVVGSATVRAVPRLVVLVVAPDRSAAPSGP